MTCACHPPQPRSLRITPQLVLYLPPNALKVALTYITRHARLSSSRLNIHSSLRSTSSRCAFIHMESLQLLTVCCWIWRGVARRGALAFEFEV
ncbi:hypothetical protein K504DRAFT_134417 [Pleomassaria siparia CBS 279.74]|uniref:Uncharacterized protein n=1 Tax=Pleomassaria siparia CBS 279.74 TaxID=1314801 RepID=A0A6G1KLB6_9PLEO|nr:hypothetical protein K504DRAFT_134417 [Pleomassaria siparia CBS 279.74]